MFVALILFVGLVMIASAVGVIALIILIGAGILSFF